jgi:hypothetical protein
VVGQPDRLVPGRHHQVGQNLAVQLDAPAGGGLLHRQAGEHGVAHGRRHLRAGGAEHLGDEERVAAGDPVETVGVDPLGAGQRGHGLPGQRRELEAAHPARGRQVADDPAQRVPGPDVVVAVGHHHHRRRAGHPAADEDEQVQERAEQAVPGRLGGDQGRHLPAGLAGDVAAAPWPDRSAIRLH